VREGGLQVAELVTLPANVQAARSEDERPGRVPVAVDLADHEGLLMMRNLSMSTSGIVVPPGGSPDGAWHHTRTLEVSETGQLPRAG